jgi:TIMELESS-interacting protein
VQISFRTLLFGMNVLRTCDTVLLLMIQQEPGIRPGEGGAGEPLAPRETEKHQDGGTSGGSKPSKIELTDEQKARMEANRLKALERAAAARARASQSQPTAETTT